MSLFFQLYEKITPITQNERMATELTNVLVDAIEGKHSELATKKDLVIITSVFKQDLESNAVVFKKDLELSASSLKHSLEMSVDGLRKDLQSVKIDFKTTIAEAESNTLKHIVWGVGLLAALETVLKFTR